MFPLWKEVAAIMPRSSWKTLSLCLSGALLASPLWADSAPAVPPAPIPAATSVYPTIPPTPPVPAPYGNASQPFLNAVTQPPYQTYPFGAGAIYGTPGGYEGRVGSPYHYYDPRGGEFVTTGDPYYDHWGPGYHRQSLYGHYRFPYYNYRAPWYYPGRAVYNRDTNFAW